MKIKYAILLAVVLLAGAAFAGCATREPETKQAPKGAEPAAAGDRLEGKKALVVYFSYTGNTRALARQIHEIVGGELFELEPATPYSADYKTVERQGKEEVETGYRPPLKAAVENLASYDVIYVGTPIWWYTIAPPVATFLAQPDLSGKTIVPFCTHGGYGAGHSLDDIKKLAPESNVTEELVLPGAERYDAREIKEWLQKVGFPQKGSSKA